MNDNLDHGVDFDGLLMQCSNPMFVVNRQRRIIFYNSSCERLTGVPAASVLGQICPRHSRHRAGDPVGLAGNLRPPDRVFMGKTATTHLLVVRPNGERLWRRIDFWPLCDDQGEVIAVLGRIDIADDRAGSPANHDWRDALLRLRRDLADQFGFDRIIASSSSMRRVVDQVRLASRCRAAVLLTGERGVGKEEIARVIHYQSDGAGSGFAVLDCDHLPPAMLDTELNRLIIEANEYASEPTAVATVYLRQPQRLPEPTQLRLASFLQQRPVDAWPRLITGIRVAGDQAETGELTEPLFNVLSTLEIAIPPLRHRQEDIPLLVQAVIERLNAQGDRQIAGMQNEALELLRKYHWPGNIAELVDVLSEAHARAASEEISIADLPPALRTEVELAEIPTAPRAWSIELDKVLAEAEKRVIRRALHLSRGNLSRAARQLGISRPRLYRRMVALGLIEPDNQDGQPFRRKRSES